MPHDSVQDEVAQRILPAGLLLPGLDELRDLQVQPQLPPPLHALRGGGPRGGAAGHTIVAHPLPRAVVHAQRHGRIPVAGPASNSEELRGDRAEPLRQPVQFLGFGALRGIPGRADEGREVGPYRVARTRVRHCVLRRSRRTRRGGSCFGIRILWQLAPVLRRRAHALRVAEPRPRLQEVRAHHHPRPRHAISLLVHELASRAPHVRRGALLQPGEASSSRRSRHAGNPHPDRCVEGNARDLETPAERA